MNADEFLRHYDRVADAPDSVGRLRGFVLDLAVRGKLVPQDSAEEPSISLIHQIAEAKARLLASGEAPKERQTPALAGGQPFALPDGWQWVPFGELHQLVRGVTYSKSDVSEVPADGFVPVLRANNIDVRLTHDEPVYVKKERVSPDQFLRRGDFMIALSSGSKNLVGKAAVVPDNYQEAFGGFCGVVRLYDHCVQHFVWVYLRSALYRESISAGSRGIGINNLKKETITSLHFPLPPLAEQHRIVAKVVELMALCDRLEVARAEREAARDRLTAATLARLNSPDPESVSEDVRFALDALPALAARPKQLRQIRQTILNLAASGKLATQAPNDEPASDLVRRMRAADSPLAAVARSGEAGYASLPAGWAVVELSEIAHVGTGLTPSRARPDYFDPPVIPWVTSGETGAPFIAATAQHLSPTALKETSLKLYPPGTLLVAMYGQGKTRGQVTELQIEATTNQACAAIVLKLADVGHRRYIKLFFEKMYDEIRELSAGGAQPNLNVGKIKSTIIPLPPLSEQHRIVAKVDELMRLCDWLEASLASAEAHRSRLLESLLHQTLEYVEPQEEAA